MCVCVATEEATTDGQTEEGGLKEEEESGISAPMVLSQERMDEVRTTLENMEEKLKKLQVRREGGHGGVKTDPRGAAGVW